MTEHPILFTGEMVRAILAGRKTQTCRVVKLPKGADQPDDMQWHGPTSRAVALWDRDPIDVNDHGGQPWCHEVDFRSPCGVPGDRLWVRETWARAGEVGDRVEYRADNPDPTVGPWRPSIFMPKKYARIWLDVDSVRVERVQDISEEGAQAEGVRALAPLAKVEPSGTWGTSRDLFAALWDSINAKRGYSWASNPWVWVVEFRRAT